MGCPTNSQLSTHDRLSGTHTSETQRRGAVVTIESRNAAYSSTALAAPRGQVTVVLTHDLFWHTFTIDELTSTWRRRWAAAER